MLLLIDLQNDYFHEKGKYFHDGFQRIVEPICKRIRKAIEKDEKIFYTINRYTQKDERSMEEKEWAEDLFPPFKDLLEKSGRLEKIYYGISPEVAGELTDDFHPEKEEVIEIAGVETDLCVISNAVIMINLFPENLIRLDRNNCATHNSDMEESAYKIMEGMNAEII